MNLRRRWRINVSNSVLVFRYEICRPDDVKQLKINTSTSSKIFKTRTRCTSASTIWIASWSCTFAILWANDGELKLVGTTPWKPIEKTENWGFTSELNNKTWGKGIKSRQRIYVIAFAKDLGQWFRARPKLIQTGTSSSSRVPSETSRFQFVAVQPHYFGGKWIQH